MRIVVDHLVEQLIAENRVLPRIAHPRFEHLHIHRLALRVKRIIRHKVPGFVNLAELRQLAQLAVLRVRLVFVPEADSVAEEAAHHRLIPRIFAPAHFKPAVGQPPRRVKRIDFIRVVDHHIHTEHAHQPRRPFHVELPAAEQEGAAAIAGERISGDPDILRAGII